MSLAAFTQPEIVEKVEAAALLSPISFLDHVDAPFVLRMVNMHIDQVFAYFMLFSSVDWIYLTSNNHIGFVQMILAMGIHELNLRRFYLNFSFLFSHFLRLLVYALLIRHVFTF